MTRVLIPTHVGDIHATAIGRALRAKGHEAVLWFGSDYPTRQCVSLSTSAEEGLRWEARGPDLRLVDESYDVVWLRRLSPALLPEEMHPGDKVIAERECKAFNRALWQLIAPDAFWVNPLSSRERSNLKPVQLLEASRVGLKIPPTLCSNDPNRIRRFLERYEGNVIFKPFMPAQWMQDGGVAVAFTSLVRAEDLPDDDILQLSPGIFQPRIEKDYELRVTYIGDYCSVAKLLSQGSEVSKVDWRAAFGNLPLLPWTLPEAVDRACRALMRRLGIVFGCFDLVVTPEGEHVFLEVNEMGQFLWLDELNPEFRLFEAFCELLIRGRCSRDWKPSPGSLHFRDFVDDDEQRRIAAEDLELHVVKPNYQSVDDRLPTPHPATEPPASPQDGGASPRLGLPARQPQSATQQKRRNG